MDKVQIGKPWCLDEKETNKKNINWIILRTVQTSLIENCRLLSKSRGRVVIDSYSKRILKKNYNEMMESYISYSYFSMIHFTTMRAQSDDF